MTWAFMPGWLKAVFFKKGMPSSTFRAHPRLFCFPIIKGLHDADWAIMLLGFDFCKLGKQIMETTHFTPGGSNNRGNDKTDRQMRKNV